jgi:phenylalanyl-tRNA synthetase alpha subunit
LVPLRCKGCGGEWLEHGGPGLVVKDLLKEIGSSMGE